MKKSLSERIAEKAAQKNLSQKGKNRAAVLALREDIKQALKDGWPVKSIWETLHDEGKIDFTYQNFRGYINRLILPETFETETEPARNNNSQNPKIENKKPATEIIKPKEIPGFTFNSVPKKEDLL